MASGLTLLLSLTGLLIVGGLGIYAIMVYNGLVRLKNNIEKSWSNIDVLLKQRSDELPKLIDTAQEYMDYEQETLQQITEARNKAQDARNPAQKADADQAIRGALGNFFAVAEDYPELKSNESFQKLQNRISELESQIADRREFYNESVNTYNIRINQIPYNVMANMMNYTEKELFEATEQEREDVDISTEFNN